MHLLWSLIHEQSNGLQLGWSKIRTIHQLVPSLSREWTLGTSRAADVGARQLSWEDWELGSQAPNTTLERAQNLCGQRESSGNLSWKFAYKLTKTNLRFSIWTTNILIKALCMCTVTHWVGSRKYPYPNSLLPREENCLKKICNTSGRFWFHDTVDKNLNLPQLRPSLPCVDTVPLKS